MSKKKKGQWVVIRAGAKPMEAELCYYNCEHKRMSEAEADALIKELSKHFPHYLYVKACLK